MTLTSIYHDWSTPLPLRFGALLCWATVTWNFSIFNRCCLSQHYKVVCIQGLLSLSSPGVGKWVPTAAGKAKEGMAHSDCGWTCGRAGKTLKSPENTRHTWALLCGGVLLWRGAVLHILPLHARYVKQIVSNHVVQHSSFRIRAKFYEN